MLEKLRTYLKEHFKGVIVMIIACILTLCTSVYLMVPMVTNIIECNQIIDSVGGEESITPKSATVSNESLFENGNIDNTYPTSVVDTEEYKEKQKEISKIEKRIEDLNDDLMITLNKSVSDFFVDYTEYAMSQTPANLEKLKKYVTDDYYDSTFKTSEVKEQMYTISYIRFADFDKDTISAFVRIKNTDDMYILSYINVDSKGWLINNIQKVDKS